MIFLSYDLFQLNFICVDMVQKKKKKKKLQGFHPQNNIQKYYVYIS